MTDQTIADALANDRVIDITTTGRTSRSPRRIEIWFFNVDGELYLTGAPGAPRHWYRNLCASPEFTLHLKQSVQADLPATARPITADADREPILRAILALFEPDIPPEWMPGRSDEDRRRTEQMFATIQADPEAALPAWLADSPLAKIELR